MKPETFYNLLAEQNLPLSDQQKKQFERYFAGPKVEDSAR